MVVVVRTAVGFGVARVVVVVVAAAAAAAAAVVVAVVAVVVVVVAAAGVAVVAAVYRGLLSPSCALPTPQSVVRSLRRRCPTVSTTYRRVVKRYPLNQGYNY